MLAIRKVEYMRAYFVYIEILSAREHRETLFRGHNRFFWLETLFSLSSKDLYLDI